MSTSIDIKEAKKILSKILDKEISDITLDLIAEIWVKWEVNPSFESLEAAEFTVRCTFIYGTHKLYNDLKATSGWWSNHLMASLDCILLMRHSLEQDEHK